MDKGRKHTHSFSTMPARLLTVCVFSAAFLNLAGCLTDTTTDPQHSTIASDFSSSSADNYSISNLSSSEFQSSSSETVSEFSSSFSSSSSFESNSFSEPQQEKPEQSSSSISSSFIIASSSSSLQPDTFIHSSTTIDGISILADSSFFMDKFNSSSIKIAFNDEETNELNYIEINGNTIRHEIIATPTAPNHPQFSPDGSKLAFSSGAEGILSQSDLYVIDLSSPQRQIQKLEAASAAIPRWRITETGDTAILYNDYIGSDQDSIWLLSGTFLVSYSNNTFGVPLKLFNRSYNGGVSTDNALAVTGSSKFLFHYASDDDSVNIDMYNGEQVCNVSISRDSNKIISFLEARGSRGREFTQNMRYHWHQYIFYTDSTGNILKAIKCEDGFVFNGTEWLYVPGYQIGTLISTEGESERLALINYESESYFTIILAPGKQIVHPDLWVGTF